MTKLNFSNKILSNPLLSFVIAIVDIVHLHFSQQEMRIINLSILHKCRDRTASKTTALPLPREVSVAPISFTSFNLCEEYTNAFRTDSYAEFWARVVDLTFKKGSTNSKSNGTTSSLPPHHLFVDSLLDPDQATVAAVLDRDRIKGSDTVENHAVLFDYFDGTADASLLCGLMLKDVEQVRLRCRSLRKALDSGANIEEHLMDLSTTPNPFSSDATSQQQFLTLKSTSSTLLRRLDTRRTKTRAKLRLATALRRTLAIFLITTTATVSITGILLALHAIIILTSLPFLLPGFLRSASTRWLRRAVARLDAAAKGTYILNRDLDTISRLVARLHDEVDHMVGLIRFWARRPTTEVVRQLKKNLDCFQRQLDELEEHLFLCFVTINKARNLVIKEICVVK